MLLIPDEQKEMWEAILKICLPIRPIRDPPTVVRTDSASGFKSLQNNEYLQNHHILIEVGNPKNLHNNPVIKKAVQDIERVILKVDPTGSQVSSASITIACCTLNNRLGSLGLSPRKVFYHQDQFTNKHIHFDDMDLTDQQHCQYTSNHPCSKQSKAPNCTHRSHTEVEVGDILYFHGNLKKTMAVKGTRCHPNRKIGSMSGRLQALS